MSNLLYAVTLNWNRKEDTLACLASFQQVQWPEPWQVRLLVVDNGSTDGTVEAVQEQFPAVELLRNEENEGFARGANHGIRHALNHGARAVFLFNNDTFFDPSLGSELLAALEPAVAAVAPAIYYASPPDAIWSLGGERHPWTLEISDNHGRNRTTLPAEPFDRAVLTGCAVLFSREALQQIGLFDEQFFMYYEDSDWSLRAKRLGWRLVTAPQARMWHKEAQSSGGLGSASERFHMGRASVQFFRKNARGAQWAVIIPFRIASALRTTLRLARQGRPDAARSYWRGLWTGLWDEVRADGVNCAP